MRRRKSANDAASESAVKTVDRAGVVLAHDLSGATRQATLGQRAQQVCDNDNV